MKKISIQKNQTTPKMSSTRKSCKVCIDAGKSEEIYTSHKTKNGRGKVVCPTLLSNTCHCCKQKGHTVKYCPETKEQPRPPEPDTPPPEEIKVTPISTMVIHKKTSDKQSYASILMIPPARPVVIKAVQVTPVIATVEAFNAYIKQNTEPKPKRKHCWASDTSSESEDEPVQQHPAKTNALKKVLHLDTQVVVA
jgi:hypothetical protein